MGEPLDLRVADGGVVFDLDLAVASGEDADGERAVRIRLRRQIGGCRRVAVAARVVGEFCEQAVDVDLGDVAAKIGRRPFFDGFFQELRAVLLDVDAREAKRHHRLAAACIVRQAAFQRVFLCLFRQVRIGWLQVRRCEGCARQEERRRKGQCKYDVRAFCFNLQRKDSFSQRFKKSRRCAIKGSTPEFRGPLPHRSGRVRALRHEWDAVYHRCGSRRRSQGRSAAQRPARVRQEVRPAVLRHGW